MMNGANAFGERGHYSAAAEPAIGLCDLTVMNDAHSLMRKKRAAQGDHVVFASWPGGATALPVELYQRGKFDVVIGQVGGCLIYADRRQVAYYADRRLVLTTAGGPKTGRNQILILRQDAASSTPARRKSVSLHIAADV